MSKIAIEEHPDGIPVYNFEVEATHTYYVHADDTDVAAVWVHNAEYLPTRKRGGRLTEPKLPDKTIVESNGVKILHYTRSGDHGPAHLHVKGGGKETKIGMNGKPIEGSAELSTSQYRVVRDNIRTIRRALDRIQRWYRFNES